MRCTCPACAKEMEANVAEDAGRIHCLHCGHEFHPAAAFQTSVAPGTGEREVLLPGTRLGQYVIGEVLGAGGMSVVYRATQTSLRREVALKVLPRGLADDPEFKRRFHREERTLALLKHPNIVAIYDQGEESGRFFFAMELVEGKTLREYVAERRDRPEEWLPLMLQVCDALEHAHAMGFVHRDIKPENILVDREGRVKVADFGLVRLIQGDNPAAPAGMNWIPGTTYRSSTPHGLPLGTPSYTAPEQREDATSADGRSDLYSFGVTLFEMLTRALPEPRRLTPLPSTRAHVDPRIDPIVERLMAYSSVHRYQNATDLKRDFTRFLGVMLPRDVYDAKVRTRDAARARAAIESMRLRWAVILASAAFGVVCLVRAGGTLDRWELRFGSPGWTGALSLGVSMAVFCSILPGPARRPRHREDRWLYIDSFFMVSTGLFALFVIAFIAITLIGFKADLSNVWCLLGGMVEWGGTLVVSHELRTLHARGRERSLGVNLFTLALLAGGWLFLGAKGQGVATVTCVSIGYLVSVCLVIQLADLLRRR